MRLGNPLLLIMISSSCTTSSTKSSGDGRTVRMLNLIDSGLTVNKCGSLSRRHDVHPWMLR